MAKKEDKKIEENVAETTQETTETADDIEEIVEDINEEDEIARLNQQIDKLKNDYARAYADTENLKKRHRSGNIGSRISPKRSCRCWIIWSVRWRRKSALRMRHSRKA